jgi:hypothetical protein
LWLLRAGQRSRLSFAWPLLRVVCVLRL